MIYKRYSSQKVPSRKKPRLSIREYEIHHFVRISVSGIARTRTARYRSRGEIPTPSRGPEKFESPEAVRCQWLWRGELAGCNCIKLAVTRPCINHSCGSGRTAGITHGARTRVHTCARVHACEPHIGLACGAAKGSVPVLDTRYTGFLKRSLCGAARLAVMRLNYGKRDVINRETSGGAREGIRAERPPIASVPRRIKIGISSLTRESWHYAAQRG